MLSLLSTGISTEGEQCGQRSEEQNQEGKLEGICLWGNGTLNAELHRFLISLDFIQTDHYQLCSVVPGEKERIYLIQKILWRSKVFFFPLCLSVLAGGTDSVS